MKFAVGIAIVFLLSAARALPSGQVVFSATLDATAKTAASNSIKARVENQFADSLVISVPIDNTNTVVSFTALGDIDGTTIQSWGEDGNTTLANEIQQDTGAAAQPSFSSTCTHNGEAVESVAAAENVACQNTVTIQIVHKNAPVNVRDGVCVALTGAAGCSQVVATSVSSSDLTPSFPTAAYTITLLDGNTLAGTVGQLARNAGSSALASAQVIAMRYQTASGTFVPFYVTTSGASSGSIDTRSCAQRLWYLLFLILLVPLQVVVVKQAFARGRRRGISDAKYEAQG